MQQRAHSLGLHSVRMRSNSSSDHFEIICWNTSASFIFKTRIYETAFPNLLKTNDNLVHYFYTDIIFKKMHFIFLNDPEGENASRRESETQYRLIWK